MIEMNENFKNQPESGSVANGGHFLRNDAVYDSFTHFIRTLQKFSAIHGLHSSSDTDIAGMVSCGRIRCWIGLPKSEPRTLTAPRG